MPINITILGTSSMVPTKERNVSGTYLEFRGDGILIDCGEGTQRQMNIAGINRNKVKHILITHWHGDHVAGLIGMLQTVGNQLGVKTDEFQKEKHQVHLYGPRGTKERMHHLMRATIAETGKIDVIIHELPMQSGKILDTEYYEIWAMPLRHSTPVLGYAFVEKDRRRIDLEKAAAFGLKQGKKVGDLSRGETVEHKGKTITPEDVCYVVEGKKFVMIPDTRVCNEAIELAEGADILLCEATFDATLEEKARKFKHMTAEQAAGIAQQAGAKQLILTHFSQRYKQVDHLVDEARTLFPNTLAAHDLMKITL